jgi:predicted metal-dependent hydrolase
MDYDPRYLAGILFFNAHDFFEAHEVWEDLWAEAAGPERRFYQGLIQAAVGLHHFSTGNVRGAVKLYHTSRAYMEPLDQQLLGLDKPAFWRQMEHCFAGLLADEEHSRHTRLDEESIPNIHLDPPPDAWPDLAAFGDDQD